MNAAEKGAIRKRLKALSAFLPEFESPDFKLFPVKRAFVKTCYETGWMQAHFDWVAWQGTAEATRLMNDSNYIDEATPIQLSRLLTALIRSERFGGDLGAFVKSGLITRILRRIAVLAAASSPDYGEFWNATSIRPYHGDFE